MSLPMLNGPTSSTSGCDVPPNSSSNDKLTKFREAIGIYVKAQHDDDLELGSKGTRGLYKKIIDIQQHRNQQHFLVEVLTYIALGINLLVGAVLTSLGPQSKLHPLAITVLGATNTFTAGILALLKSQGLQVRIHNELFQMRKVQDFIEETETKLFVQGENSFTRKELDEVVQDVFNMYNAALEQSGP